ncbi:MAG TPA: hypothetical protein VNV35_01275 [Puia sp.]|nr:hypothetical protein [Puia sp.]
MMKYLLLRDNKQSGPYTVDELKVKGLKAYDLVWVEGRSAAWRYPSEIDELSAFAPAVEEQPFDRFFKKPAVASSAATPANTQPEGKAAITMTQPGASSNSATRRTIYVTMPGGMTVREIAPVREIVREITPVREAVAPARDAVAPPLREAAPVRERVSYVQEPATEILPPLPRRKQGKVWIPVAIGGGVLVLLAAGIFIGVSIQRNAAGSLKLASKEQPVRTTAQQLPVSPATGTTTSAGNATGKGQPAPLITQSNNYGSAAVRPGKPRVTSLRQKTEAVKTAAGIPAVVADSNAVQQADQHREAVHRTDALQSTAVDNHESVKLTLANQVSVGANKYDVGTFGGIHNLQVTVTNHSTYSLDLVVVAVSYIQANKKTYKTENLYFRGIAPGSALMLEAPKSSRGINVEYKITSINSKELGLSEPGT